MKETGPEAVPPPASVSFEDRSTDRLVPVPEPNLNSMPSVLASSRIDSIVSSTELMKHAEAWADRPGTPMLNHTGLLKDACWVTSSQRSSSSQVTTSSSPAKYAPSRPHRPSVVTTRSTICFTLYSRSEVPRWPRKYFCATTLVASCDHERGTSTSFCSKKTAPFSLVMEAVRRSHSTRSWASLP